MSPAATLFVRALPDREPVTLDRAPNQFEFEGFRLDCRSWTLRGPDGSLLALTPKAFDALVLFLERPGEVIDRETLIESLWPNTVVEDNNLSQVVAALRRALGDERIRTVPRRGYALVADVRDLAAAQDLAAAPDGTPDTWLPPQKPADAYRKHPAGAISSGIFLAALLLLSLTGGYWYTRNDTASQMAMPPSLAVLPFADTSLDGDLEPLANAVAMELLTTLALVDGLDVRGSTSSFWFRDRSFDLATVRELLGVDYILEGDVRSAGDRLRISIRLTDATSGSQIWSESYDRTPGDILALQDEIARNTAQALEITLGVGELGRRPGTTRNAEAFLAFVAADRTLAENGRFSVPAVREAIAELERAVMLDENFALGWFELYWQSRWLQILAIDGGGSAPGAAARADHALARVEALLPGLPELAMSKLETGADAHEIARAFEQLLGAAARADYAPAFLYEVETRFLRFTGRVFESIAAAERARAVDPLNEVIIRFLAEGYSAEGRQREALALLDEFARLGVESPMIAGTALVIALEFGDRDEIARRAAGMGVSQSTIVRELGRNVDNPELALRLLRDFAAAPDPTLIPWPTLLAPWAAYFGDDALALEMYRQEVPFATGNSISRPIFAGMRRLPGFRDLVRDVGLTAYWRESGIWPDYCRPLDRDEIECY